VPAAGRDVRQGTSRRHAEQPAIGVELVEEAVEIVLAGAAAMVEDERASRLPGRLPDQVDQGFRQRSRRVRWRT
jgi:hypothetical protein